MIKIYKSTGLLLFVLLVCTMKAQSQDVFEMTVAIDGSGDYSSIQQAIDACK